LYEGYSEWCVANGHAAISQPQFGKELARKGFQPKKSRNGNRWLGLEIKPERPVGR
jgi:phage/plasmid-associated DNA primase